MIDACTTGRRGRLIERSNFAPADATTPLVVVLAGRAFPRSQTAFVDAAVAR